jgi:hypothetical protein
MTSNPLLISFLRLLVAYLLAWFGIVIGLLAPFQIAPTQPSMLLNPILPAVYLLMGLCSTILTACVAILAVAAVVAFVIIHKLPWWSCAAIFLSFAALAYTLKNAWAS